MERHGFRVVYFSYWGIDEGISQATVMPSIQALLDNVLVKEVVLVSTERSDSVAFVPPPGVLHVPVYTVLRPTLFQRLSFFIKASIVLMRALSSKHSVLWCRSSSAATVAVPASFLALRPLVVESFEPHADYMIDARRWSAAGFKARLQRLVEHLAVRRARALITVSHLYAQAMSQKRAGVYCAPCPVSPSFFDTSVTDKAALRRQLGIPENAWVGIYAGKFGDIYCSVHDALKVFRLCTAADPNFYAVALTEVEGFLAAANSASFDLGRSLVRLAPHSAVPLYMRAADFGFSFVLPSPNRPFCCPIKHGEYWASGLPILMADSVGDDSQLCRENRAGVVYSGHMPTAAEIGQMRALCDAFNGGVSRSLAADSRSLNHTRKAINEALLLIVNGPSGHLKQ